VPISPFCVTNVTLDDGSSEMILQGTNGLTLSLKQQRITLYFGTDNTVTVWFDPKTKRLSKILLETPDSERGPGEWITDFNADGIPDARRIKGKDGSEVFYNGIWLTSTPGNGTNAYVTIDGKPVPLFFDGIRWVKSIEPISQP
jgi:hypothetical protein